MKHASKTVLGIAAALSLVAAAPPPDPGAVAAVKAYVAGLARADYDASYALLPASQQKYFRSRANFASVFTAAQYAIHSYDVASTLSHGAIVEVVMRQSASFLDIGTGKTIEGVVREPYFALRENGQWRVKQLYQPWKSYAPNATGSAHGVDVVINRVEFYDHRVRLDCTVRNRGEIPVQVLPLGKTTLQAGTGTAIAAMNDATFPLNDVGFYEGLRVYPNHQAVGYVNFPLTQKADEAQNFTLTMGPAIEDGANDTFYITVGPVALAKL